MIHNVTAHVGPSPIVIETGKLAKLADGAVTVRSGDSIVLGERRINKPAFIVLGSDLTRYGNQLAAASAFYLDADGERPPGFILSGVTLPKNIDKLGSHVVDGRIVVLTPRDAPWLKPNEMFVASRIEFPLLASGSRWRTYASMPELVRELKNPSGNSGADVRVAIHTRILQFFMDGTLVMLGLPVMLSRRSRNAYVSIGLCLLVATLFMLTALACQSLGGLNMLRPSLAAWLPLLVFVPVAAAMSGSFRT